MSRKASRKHKRTRRPAVKAAATKHTARGGANASGIAKALFTAWLERFSIGYLALPAFLFLFGFMRPLLGIPVAALLGAAIWFYFKSAGNAKAPLLGTPAITESAPIPVSTLLLGFAIALVVCGLLGAGGWGYQNGDWVRSNGFLHDLTFQSWPPEVVANNTQYFLVYAVSYYLPAALFGKMFGFAAANHFLLLWTAAGVFLALLWVFAFSKTNARWIILLFFFFSGMDAIGTLLNFGSPHSIIPEHADTMRAAATWKPLATFHDHIETWVFPVFSEFSGIVTGIGWFPQHLLPVWLLFGAALMRAARGNLPQSVGLFAALCSYWTVFPTLGLGILLAVYLLWELFARRIHMPEFISRVNIFCVPPLLCIALYYAATTVGGNLFGAAHAPFNGEWLTEIIGKYIAFFMLEVGILWLLLYFANRHASGAGAPIYATQFKRMFCLAMLLPPLLWFIGGDVFHRGLIPPLALSNYYGPIHALADLQRALFHAFVFVLLLATVWMLEAAAQPAAGKMLRNIATAIVAVLVIGAWTPVVDLNTALNHIHKRGTFHGPLRTGGGNVPIEYVRDRPLLQISIQNNPQREKYFGSRNSWFYRYLSRNGGVRN